MAKILLIQHTNIIGGSLKGAIDLLECIVDKNNEIFFYIHNPTREICAFCEKYDIKLVMCHNNVISFDYFNGCNTILRVIFKFILRLPTFFVWQDHFDTNHYDVVILNTSVLWPLRRLIQNSGAKCFCYIRETLKGKRYSFINKIICKELSLCDKVFFLTNFDFNTWNLTLSPSASCVFPEMVRRPNTIRSKKELFSQYKIKNNGFFILYMGGMQQIKGADVIIQAMALINHTKYKNLIKLIFMGDSGLDNTNLLNKVRYYHKTQYQKEWNQKVVTLQLDNCIYRIGYQYDVYSWIAASDIVVFPTQNAHQARPIYEAGIMHRTIIVPKFVNYMDNLQHNYNGLMFTPGDIDDLVNKIITLYENRDLLITLSENNYKLATDNHLFDTFKEKINQICCFN